MFGWIEGLVEGGGYVAIAFLMFLENVFPPIPSELIMPLSGFVSARGGLNIALAIVAGSIGSIAGAVLWYYVGVWIGCERLKRWAARHGRWLTLAPKEIDRADAWFDRHGGKAVFLGRLVPGVRTLISVPAGIAHMPRRAFLLFTTVGTVLWTAALGLAGYVLGSRYDAVSTYVGPVGNVIVGLIILWYLYRVVTWRRPAEASATSRS